MSGSRSPEAPPHSAKLTVLKSKSQEGRSGCLLPLLRDPAHLRAQGSGTLPPRPVWPLESITLCHFKSLLTSAPILDLGAGIVTMCSLCRYIKASQRSSHLSEASSWSCGYRWLPLPGQNKCKQEISTMVSRSPLRDRVEVTRRGAREVAGRPRVQPGREADRHRGRDQAGQSACRRDAQAAQGVCGRAPNSS